MWFTPLAWLVMWTRSWDIDPAIVWFLNNKENLNNQEIDNILNKKSWLLWISWQSSDLRDIETWNAQCQLALDIYINRIIEYIGAYIALMWGVDTIVFTAGVGERSPIVRQRVVNSLSYLWIKLDEDNNNIKSKEIKISTPDSKVNVIVVPTKEELMIATDTFNLINAIL
jgi:acetate kinase